MSSILGLGAAGLGAAAMGASSLGRKGKQKQIKTPQPSSQDYLNSYLTAIGNQKLSDKQRAEALFGGPIKSVSGDFYYGGPPKKIPEGAFVAQGQPLTQAARTRNEGYYTREIDIKYYARQGNYPALISPLPRRACRPAKYKRYRKEELR
jgi:hypothetical protein